MPDSKRLSCRSKESELSGFEIFVELGGYLPDVFKQTFVLRKGIMVSIQSPRRCLCHDVSAPKVEVFYLDAVWHNLLFPIVVRIGFESVGTERNHFTRELLQPFNVHLVQAFFLKALVDGIGEVWNEARN